MAHGNFAEPVHVERRRLLHPARDHDAVARAAGVVAGRAVDRVALGAAVEERGFHSYWAPEHVVFFETYESQYPYPPAPGSPAANHGHQDCVFNAMDVGCVIVSANG